MRLLIWEIEASKFAINFFGQLVIGTRRRFWSHISARGISAFSLDTYLGSPSTFTYFPKHSTKPRRPGFLTTIGHVLRSGARQKIRSLIVQPIAVAMMNMQFFRHIENLPMHINSFLFSVFHLCSCCVEKSTVVAISLPFILRNKLHIFLINERMFPLSKRNSSRFVHGIFGKHCLTPGYFTASGRGCIAPQMVASIWGAFAFLILPEPRN